ncbi:MAG TPA: YcxB family protein [Abditibacteriaceae bacterium]|jgi:hypothetical protein
MEITYRLTPDAISALETFHEKRRFGFLRYVLFAAMGAAGILSLYLQRMQIERDFSRRPGPTPNMPPFPIMIGLFFGFVALVLWTRRRQRAALAIEPIFVEPHTLRIEPDGIHVRNALGDFHHYWRAIREIAHDDKYLYLWTDKDAALVVPKTAFNGDDEYQQFFAKLNAFQKTAQTN